MSIELQVTPHPAYLYVALTGHITVQSAKEALTQVLDAAWELRQPHILIDWRPVAGLQSLSVIDRFDTATFLVGLVRQLRGRGMPNVRIAQITDVFRAGVDDFSQTVAANRGVALRITASLSDALTWLRVSSVDGQA